MVFKLPVFDKSSYKGQHGKVLIIGGSHKYYGPPIFNAAAAESAGADLITLFLPEAHVQTAKNYSLNLFIESFVHQDLGLKDIALIIQAAEKHDAILIGSGIGTDPDSKRAIKLIISEISKPLVLDADALHPDILDVKRNSEWLITPHKGEYKRLFGENPELDSVHKLAQKHNMCIVAKGATDIIAYNDQIYSNTTGCPQMRVGGTGDALAGIITSYIAQGLSIFDAAVSSCHYFGKLGSSLLESEQNLTTLKMIKGYSSFIKRLSL
jgi:NAD(P)H-hydrate epimerase